MNGRIIGVLAAVAVTGGCFSGATGADDEHRLKVALAFPPAQRMSPYGDDALLLSRLGVTDSLVRLDDTGEPAPALAEKWTRVDDTTWRFTIRDGVRFHDGTTLTAGHAADALSEAAEASPVPRALRGVHLSAEAIGDHELEIETGEPDPVLPQRMSSPNLAVLAPSAYTGDGVDPREAGTGPFVLESLDGKQRARLDAFDDHWEGKPEATGIDVRFVPDAGTRAASLRSGQVDVADGLPISEAGQLGDAGLLEVPLPRLVSLHLNTADGPMTDPGLRAAVREVADPETLAESIFEGRADPASGLFGPASPWADDREKPAYRKPGKPSGQKLTIATYSDRAELPEVLTVIGDALEDEGFTVEQVVREYSELESDLLQGEFDLVLGTRSYLLDTGDPGSYLASDLTCHGAFNLSRLCDAKIDKAIARANQLKGVTERRQAALEIERRVLTTDAIVPLVHEQARIGTGKSVKGLVPDPYERRLVTRETSRS